MNAICKKLKSKRGASMLVALMYLMVALILGAVVLAAASANAGRMGRSQKERLRYYAVDSAAQLIEKDLANTTALTVTQTQTRAQTWNTTTNSYGDYGAPSTASSVNFTTTSKLLTALNAKPNPAAPAPIEKFLTDPDAAAMTMDFTLDLYEKDEDSNDILSEDVPSVSGSLTIYMDGVTNYRISVEIYVPEGTGPQMIKREARILNFVPLTETGVNTAESTLGNQHSVTTTTTSTVSWGAPEVNKG